MPQDKDAISGRLRDRVTYQTHPEESRNDLGEPVEQWQTVAVLWANVRTASGRELLYAQQVQATASTVVEIRYRPGVDRKGRFLFAGRTLNIDAVVDEDNLQVRLLCYCTEPR